jgi:hypothetical protein
MPATLYSGQVNDELANRTHAVNSFEDLRPKHWLETYRSNLADGFEISCRVSEANAAPVFVVGQHLQLWIVHKRGFLAQALILGERYRLDPPFEVRLLRLLAKTNTDQFALPADHRPARELQPNWAVRPLDRPSFVIRQSAAGFKDLFEICGFP